MLGTAPFGKMPLGAIPIFLYQELRIRKSPFFGSSVLDESIFESTTISTGDLFSATSGEDESIYEETI